MAFPNELNELSELSKLNVLKEQSELQKKITAVKPGDELSYSPPMR